MASRVGETKTAFPHRQAQFDLGILAQWTNPKEADKHSQWPRDLWQAMQPYSSGRLYVNFMGEEDAAATKAAFGANHKRLVALKNKYDPTNLFRLNVNIEPTL